MVKKIIVFFVGFLVCGTCFAELTEEGRRKIETLRAKYHKIEAEKVQEPDKPKQAIAEQPAIDKHNKAEDIFEIIHSGDVKLIQKLEEHLKIYPAAIKIKQTDGSTPLHQAAQWCKPEAVKYLLSKGAGVNAKDNKGFTPLDFATEVNASILKSVGAKQTIVEKHRQSVATPTRERLSNGDYTLHRGKRGGIYHYSASGKKVYHKR